MEKKEKQQNSFDFHISDAIAINESINPIPLRFSTMTVSQGNMEVSKSLISTALKENQKMLDVISLQK